jgi:hypothetical protein
MNKDQIKNGEVRIFPFYKDEYMGELPFGYSNKKSALKFMKDVPASDVFDRFGGKDNYVKEHEYLLGLDENNLYVFNPKRGESAYSQRRFDGIYNYDTSKKIYLKDLKEEDVNEIRKDLKNVGWYSEYEKHIIVGEFQKKWNMFPLTENSKGDPIVDWDEFDKMRRKMTREEVEFREGIVHIEIEYIKKETD